MNTELEALKKRLYNTPNERENSEILEKLENLGKQLEDIYNLETAGAIGRSRVKWAEEGEKSTKYCCTLERRRAERKNTYYVEG